VHLIDIIRRDVSSKVVGEVLSRLVFLLFFFYLGRKLGSTEFGTLNLALSLTYMLGVVLLDPGLNLAAIHMLVERQEQAATIAGSIFSTKLLMFFPFMMVLAIISLLLGTKLPSFYILFLGALWTLSSVLLEYLSSVTNAYHRMDLEAFLKIFNRILIVVVGSLAALKGGVPTVLLGMALATLVASLFAWMLLRARLITVLPKWHFATVKDAFRLALPIAGTAIVTAIYLKWDLLVLSYFNIGREQVGWYAGAFKIVEAFSALPTILGAALFPLMIQLRKQDPVSLDRLLNMSTKGVVLLSLPIAAVISLFSPHIISFIYGTAYLPGASVLAVLIWCIVPIFLYFYLVFVNIAAGHAKFNLVAGCAALLAGLTANALLVPRIGYLGAAWAALIANSTFALLTIWKVCTLFNKASIPTVLLRLVAAGGAMVAALVLTPAPIPMQLFTGLLVYGIALITLGTLDIRDLSLAIRLMQFRSQPQGQQL
jgi:O-antigen/teichoic acid export membrane protein